MPLLLLLFGLLAPRAILCIAWCLGIFTGVWSTFLWPLLGFIFLPYTTLAYGLAHAYGDGIKGIWLVVFIVAVLMDFGTHGTSASKTRRGRS
jgi:hypothetical protein